MGRPLSCAGCLSNFCLRRDMISKITIYQEKAAWVEPPLQPLTYQTRKRLVYAAGGKAHNDSTGRVG